MALRWVIGLCDRISAVVGAFIFSQVPLFFQQYIQLLAGHLAEAEYQMTKVSFAAHQSGKTLSEYIGKFLSQSDPDFVAQGHIMQEMLTRVSTLQEAHQVLASASCWWRPYYFCKYATYDIIQATCKSFTPGLTVTFETGIYALSGVLFGYLAFRSVSTVAYRLPKKIWRIAS